MTGGLINVVSYSSNDLYLTGAPQITFYKMVYRRYTNFAMESIFLNFENDLDFDNESELIPPRIGDLMHKSYLHIKVPNISITKHDVGIDTSDLRFDSVNKSSVINFEKIRTVYMNVLTNIYRIIYKAVNASNVTYAGLIQDVQEYVNSGDVKNLLSSYDALLLRTRESLISRTDQSESILNSTRSNLWHILMHINIIKLMETANKSIDTNIFEPDSAEFNKELQRIMKEIVLKQIDEGLNACKEVQNYFFIEYKKFVKKSTNDRNQNIKCAWVKNLGHSIIEHIDIFIGGKKIDRHLGIWINIWHQLTYRDAQTQIYDRLIGNVDVLTNLDNQEKPSYDIFVPLTFWFNKFNGLSFPYIAMQYNDLRFNVKLRKLEEVFFIERIYKGRLNGNEIILTAEMIDFIQNRSETTNNFSLTNIEIVDDINLSDIWSNKGKALCGHILMDYIYLESSERKRYAQSGHEYLIEIIQTNIFRKVQQRELDVKLDFTTPSKEIIWAFLKDIYTENEQSWNGCRWYDHATSNSKRNPVINAQLNFNNYVRIKRQPGLYFDKYQPFTYHKVSPTDGINLYSFCIDPLQHQPNGSCNFSRLTDVRLFLVLDEMLFRYLDLQIYPYDLDINFKINITDPIILNDLLEKIDIDYVRKIIREFTLASSNVGLTFGPDTVINSEFLRRVEDANSTLSVFNQLSSGLTIEIDLNAYRRLILKTTATLYVFNLTMNILRLIGGYGALAYSGNV